MQHKQALTWLGTKHGLSHCFQWPLLRCTMHHLFPCNSVLSKEPGLLIITFFQGKLGRELISLLLQLGQGLCPIPHHRFRLTKTYPRHQEHNISADSPKPMSQKQSDQKEVASQALNILRRSCFVFCSKKIKGNLERTYLLVHNCWFIFAEKHH